jgi:hypothetical protein
MKLVVTFTPHQPIRCSPARSVRRTTSRTPVSNPSLSHLSILSLSTGRYPDAKLQTIMTSSTQSRNMGGAPVTPPSSSEAHAPPPQPQIITPNLTLQAPLSRRGKGPGLVLVLDHYAASEAKEGCLDPPPLKKWAEEGFAVVQVCC